MIVALDGPVMPYAWGSRSALATLLGRAPTGEPEAELWVGAHPAGPARLLDPTDQDENLAQLLARDPAAWLGDDVAARYGRLPFLLKILAIAEPLSLQAHPDATQARQGFLREEALGLPRGHAERNYRDDQHKPELLLALSPVEALCGFRPQAQVLELLSAFGLSQADSPLAEASAAFSRGDGSEQYAALFRSFFSLSARELERALDLMLSLAEGRVAAEPDGATWVARWLLRLSKAYGPDPGLLVVLLLRLLRLEPGQAIFLPARRLHAYLSGVGVEIMAASDNVLRAGLTPKHVDIPELSAVVDFAPSEPDLIVPSDQGRPGVRIFRTPATEFELWSVALEARFASVTLPSPSLLLVLEGSIEVSRGAEHATFGRGGQAFVPWSNEPARISGSGRAVVAAVRQ
jgi:mannose-6-phosphate isomerase